MTCCLLRFSSLCLVVGKAFISLYPSWHSESFIYFVFNRKMLLSTEKSRFDSDGWSRNICTLVSIFLSKWSVSTCSELLPGAFAPATCPEPRASSQKSCWDWLSHWLLFRLRALSNVSTICFVYLWKSTGSLRREATLQIARVYS